MNELVQLGHALAELGSQVFACIGLAAKSRASQAGIARKLLQRQPSCQIVELEGMAFDVATFAADSGDLPNLICLVGSLKSAVVLVRGKHYPPGQQTRLYQWLVCFQRMQAMRLPIGACDYVAGGYRLPCSLLGSFHAHHMHEQVEP